MNPPQADKFQRQPGQLRLQMFPRRKFWMFYKAGRAKKRILNKHPLQEKISPSTQ
jgi:hypothetical protein